jgi:hypothetical protein
LSDAFATAVRFSPRFGCPSAEHPRPKITGISHIAVYTSDLKPQITTTRDHWRAREADPENPKGVRYAINATQFVEVLPLPANAGVNRLDHIGWKTDNAEGMRRNSRQVPARHRARGPRPAAHRVQGLLRLRQPVRRRAEHPRLPHLPRPARRAAGAEPQAVEFAVLAAKAINCEIRETSIFSRKNYFYPDSPKGYQISQFDKPIAEHGWIDVPDATAASIKRIGVTRLHMEEDAGKSIHDGFADSARAPTST